MKYQLLTFTDKEGVIKGYSALIIQGKQRNPLYTGNKAEPFWPTEKAARQAARDFIKDFNTHQPKTHQPKTHQPKTQNPTT